MTPEKALADAIKIAGGPSALARMITSPEAPVTRQAIRQWKSCPAERVLDVAAAVRKVRARPAPTKHDLRPDIYPRKTKGE